MRLKDSASPAPAGYFIRFSPDAPERGPFTLENLIDLADCQQVTPDTGIRLTDEKEWRSLGDLSELKDAIFPEKKAFHFKTYHKTDDADAGLAPVDVKNLFRCESASAADQARELVKKGKPDATDGFDPKAVLEASQAIGRARAAPPSPGDLPRERFSAGRTFFVVRWSLALLLLGIGIWVWTDAAGGAAHTIFSLIIGLIPIAGAILLTVTDIISWTLDAGEKLSQPPPPPPPDYALAEEKISAGEWAGAVTEYRRVLETHPLELRAYLAGIAAAAAADDSEKVEGFRALALEHLSALDYNLLAETLRRRGLPTLPERPHTP